MQIAIRAAEAADGAAIRELVRAERLNPTGLDWRNFVVAARGREIVGTAQLRPVALGVAELGSLAVAPAERGRGLAARLVEAALARAPERVLVIAPRSRAVYFAPWGFRTVPFAAAPWRVRINYLMGQAGSVVALLRGHAPRRLAILER
jgi:N-acetylglutamate synthase-like GNAT family acetyltransferase